MIEHKPGQPNQAAQSPNQWRFTKRAKNIGKGVTALAVGGTLYFAATHTPDLNAEPTAAPVVCEVPVTSGDTLSGTRLEFARHGANVHGKQTIVKAPDGVTRTLANSPTYLRDMGLQEGDYILIDAKGMQPGVCEAVGGTYFEDYQDPTLDTHTATNVPGIDR